MRLAAAASMFCAVFFNPAAAQNTAAPEPSPFEIQATQHHSRITWTETVGLFQSAEATAVVTALVVETPREEAGRLRGIRIDLRDAKSTQRIYLGGKRVSAFQARSEYAGLCSDFNERSNRNANPGARSCAMPAVAVRPTIFLPGLLRPA